MATAKKAPAKKVPAKKTSVQPTVSVQPTTKNIKVQERVVAKVSSAQEFRMPTEVKDWIERAESIMRNMQSKIDRLTEENVELKSYKRWAEQRILGMSVE